MPGPKKTTGSDAPMAKRPKSPVAGARSSTAEKQARRAPRPSRRHAGGAQLGRPRTGVVVTGGASGIGRATCLALAEVGRPVAVWDRDLPGARRTARRCADDFGVATVAVGIDVAVSDSFSSAVARSLAALDSIGGLVHGAGVDGAMPVTMLDEDSWDAVLDVNLRAAALLTRALHPSLVAAGDGSAIVYISSIEGFFGHSYLPAYAASKAGLLGLTRSAAHTLGADGIRVNAVCPGAVDTPMLAPLLAFPGAREGLEGRTPLGRLANPEDIAKSIRFLLCDEAAFINGASLIVDGGMTAISGI